MALRPVSNPPNPWHGTHAEWIDAPPIAGLEVFEETAKSILSKNESPDLPFTYSLNPYRGCYHGCAYCYARPSHQYWDFGAGTDFERKLVVKTNAPEVLKKTLAARSWKGEVIVFSGNTDCYQPLEASYRLTRRCLEVCREVSNPVALITKGALIRRDLDVLVDLHREARVSVNMSLAFSDEAMSRRMEPYAPRPHTRLEALRALTAAGLDVGIGLAPVIPGLNDSQIPEILKQAAAAGATRAFMVLLRLPSEVKDVFFGRLAEQYPDRVQKVAHGLEQMHGGRLYRPEFGKRGQGEGPRWQAIEWMFRTTCRKLGINTREDAEDELPSTYRRPGGEQQTLF